MTRFPDIERNVPRMFTSSSINPHKRLGPTVAILCFVLTGMLLFCGVFVVAAATADLATLPLDNVTNNQLAILAAATALIPAVIAVDGLSDLAGVGQ